MKVKVLRSFTAFVGENSVSGSQGQELDMPAGADWVRAGLVEPLEESDAEAEKAEKRAPETAVVKPPEAAVVPEGKPRGGVMSTETLKPTKG